jgi:hypothetical protein
MPYNSSCFLSPFHVGSASILVDVTTSVVMLVFSKSSLNSVYTGFSDFPLDALFVALAFTVAVDVDDFVFGLV